jgi:hypothetical protein
LRIWIRQWETHWMELEDEVSVMEVKREMNHCITPGCTERERQWRERVVDSI